MGSMAQIGSWKGVIDTSSIDGPKGKVTATLSGTLAFIAWRGAYWTKQVSTVNKVLIPMYWFKTMLFGRDVSRF